MIKLAAAGACLHFCIRSMQGMASRDRAVAANVPGGLFVDATCIDCGTCYTHAPATFRAAGGTSAVHAQPDTPAERASAHRALVACPTGSIGSDDPADTRAAASAFPWPVERDGVVLPDVHWCGYTSPDSFGAWSWLITRPQGNILVDSPRANPILETGLRARGGVSRIILTHRDDIADHEHWHQRFTAPRVAHVDEDMAFVEERIHGSEPTALADDLLVIPAPGHTAGSLCILYRDEILFTGDHVWWSGTRERLAASRDYCWFDWQAQLASLRRLLDLPVRWVLPGHGAPWRAPTAGAFRVELERTLAALEEERS